MTMKKFQYCLFDLDGTLTDPREGITKSVQYALHEKGIEEPDLEKLEDFIGPPLRDSFMTKYGMNREEAEEAVALYRKRFAPVGVYENRVFDGIPELLKALSEKGVKVAIASSKPTVFVHKILKHFKMDAYFDVVVGSELDGRRDSKEEVVEEALRQLGVSKLSQPERKSTCAMIGDRRFDIQGAKAHGLTGIGVRFGFAGEGELEAEGADYIAETVADLREFLLNEEKYG